MALELSQILINDVVLHGIGASRTFFRRHVAVSAISTQIPPGIVVVVLAEQAIASAGAVAAIMRDHA